jgi:hypothetical protein
MGAVNAMTQRCVWLQGGRIAAMGKTRKIVETYLTESVETPAAQVEGLGFYRRDRAQDTPVKITAIGVSGVDGRLQNSSTLPTVEFGSKIEIENQMKLPRLFTGQQTGVEDVSGRAGDGLVFLGPGLRAIP